MPATIVLGAQWGDEGKAKIVDFLGADAEVVVRFQGGANAGHTVKVDDQTYIFHALPVGGINPNTLCVVGNGVVLDLESFFAELDDLTERGLDVGEGRVFVSNCAHVVMPYHKALDQAAEASKGSGAIGTTGRGIGPAYRDKIDRTHGIRVMDLLDTERFRDRLRGAIAEKNQLLTQIYNAEPLDAEQIIRDYLVFAERLCPLVTDTSVLLNEALDEGKRVLFEGAQGTLLDVDHGTYPYVTSSNTTAGGACSGAGVGPTRIDEIIGVTKAYMTRVGNGPFPTELLDDEGERIRELGQEYGATTGRARRCGWFDATIARMSSRVNGLTNLALTRMDILDTVETLKLCTAYRLGDEVLEEFPADPRVLDKCAPIYEEVEGWCAPTTEARHYDDLPDKAKAYVARIEDLSRTKVSLISVGAQRDATIRVDE
ncbi:MAG TPA: adenylosuccinate synthase [Candidatus Latescibacteria bacterium]|jgi:adenylosuccinate synthase|nr:adenylosuccinate synthase [Gemmatimonadota bacterium]MDP7364521.1 adenylosuccinate synthase [Candidatus Latescibacterota bacterium]MDP7635779.1 adenylosuccinate synthase [Candidatus Latescibacterota bacterium]HJN30689.1 adenylosuccinate synthase [Candidatus Latescibacterota bacterium]|tara:strand:+ start:35 stop:1321 length:1287 start_codon:yes stop_codon:yes gene_type:complete